MPRSWLCLMRTPLGLPVEPDVYMMTARESGRGGVGGKRAASSRPLSTTSCTERICRASARVNGLVRHEYANNNDN